ncbi:MAG: hypothetical protein JXA28_03815, partial [Bacteroidetes bacterium]|nr:hypothetical protein [Bacteroidota bacterium]
MRRIFCISPFARLLFAFLLWPLLFSLSAQAQDVRVRIETDSTRFLIGEWIPLQLTVDAPASWNVRLPATDEDFSHAEFVSAEEAESSTDGARRSYRQEITVTVFDTGSVSIAAIVSYRIPDDTTLYTTESNRIELQVTTVELDTTQAFRDIKDVLHVPLTIWDYLLIAGIVLLVALLLWFGLRWYKARQQPVEDIPAEPEPDLPPAVIALRDLERLRTEQLWQKGEHKAYQSRLTDTIRAYIERRFRVPALEHPTSEIIPDVAMLGLSPEDVGGLEQVLRTADLTKFARYVPDATEHEHGMRFAVQFVENTRDDRPVPPGERELTRDSIVAKSTDTPRKDSAETSPGED